MTANFQISGKAADGRIYVVGGDNYDEFTTNLLAVFGPEMADRVVEDFQFLVDPPSQPAVAAATSVRSSPAAAAAPAPSAPGAPSCEHGPRTFRSGVGKKGPWTAYFCSQPKGAVQCEAIWG